MQSKFTLYLRWAGAVTMLLLILLLMVEGTWAIGLQHSWPFILVVILATLLLLIAGLRDLIACLRTLPHPSSPSSTAALSHLGLALVLIGGMLGAVVETDVQMVVDRHASERVAYDKHGQPVVLPFALRLTDFRIDYYPDGHSPKQFTSSLSITPSEQKITQKMENSPERRVRRDESPLCNFTSVNHPLRYNGWWIYQQNYDHEQQDFVILQLVRDPLLPLVYIGFALMAISALIETRRAWHSWKVLPVALVVAILFTAASLARIELGTLVPALRSLWFFPHILIYMVAYSLLAIALILELLNLCSAKKTFSIFHRALPVPFSIGLCPFHFQFSITKQLLQTVSALLLIGMLCGAVWAKDAWGQYWTWDAKECWAAVTWLLTIIASHLPSRAAKPWRTLLFILLTFAAMQVTWYGVNYLPSAAHSMHTYNR